MDTNAAFLVHFSVDYYRSLEYNRKVIQLFELERKRNMRESNCYKRKFNSAAILVGAMVFFLLAGCGNKDIQKDNSSSSNQSNPSGTVNEESQNNPQNTTNQDSQNNPSGTTDEGGQNNPSGTENQNSQASSVNQPQIGMEEAKEAALKHAGLTAAEVTFIKEELDYDDGKTEYDLEFVTTTTKYEYEISAEDGAVLGNSQEPVEQVPENLLGQGVISIDQAKEAALNHAGVSPEQAAYIKVELEQDDGIAQYEIEFYANGKEYSSTIQASTGAVIEYEVE